MTSSAEVSEKKVDRPTRRRQSVASLDLSQRKCRRCWYCIQICPAKAIKLEKDNIKIIPERCVLCGNCVKACPQKAFSYRSGLASVRKYLSGRERTIACLDAAFPVALDMVTPRQLVTALKLVGFTEVWEGAFGMELVRQAYERLLRQETKQPIISSFCATIVSYIQKYLPQLIPNLAPIVSPMIAMARVAKKLKGPEWKFVYITPCLAQMAEMEAPEVVGAVDQVITFVEAEHLLDAAGVKWEGLPETEFDGPRPYLGRVSPIIGGLYRSMGENFDILMDEVSVTGGHKRAIGSLNQLAGGYIQAKFLDLVFCEGCIDGPFVGRELLSGLARRQKIARYSKAEMNRQSLHALSVELNQFKDIDLSRTFGNAEQKLPTPTDEEVRAVLKKIGKEPPDQNLDCRACGYPTCSDKAVAVVQGIAEAEMCLPYLLEQSKKIYQELERSHRELQLSHQELEQAQSQLIRTEKLASLGQLAAGVAHEINNPLGTITIYTHLLLKGMDPDDPRREDVELIVSEANRTKEIVQGLLSFARETKLRPGPVDVNELLEDILGLVANQSLFHNIRIKKVCFPGLPTIVGDETQLKQVFFNIILNAAQAMEGNGKLTISTSAEKKQVKVKIRDSGPGIPPEIINNIFSPFFTTKEKGTGLGLAISYGIVEKHFGKIDVETELGKGSTFSVSLPISVGEDDYRWDQR